MGVKDGRKNLIVAESDPPKSPLKKGDFEINPVPPLLRGVRGVKP